MYDRLKRICKEHKTSVSALCQQVTGNTGNLATWQKGYMRSDWLAQCADILNCSVDYLLGRQVSTPELSENESILLSFFRECSENSQKILLDLAEHYSKQDASAKEKEKISV